MEAILLAVFFPLILGGYAWTTLTYRWLRDEINEIKLNHLKHIEKRLDNLEEHNEH